jgi:hypothetical protein
MRLRVVSRMRLACFIGFRHDLDWRLVFSLALSSVLWLLDIPPSAAHIYSVSVLFSS